MKKIVFTGGGTAGHVTPNLALITKLQKLGWEIDYIGSFSGIEQQIITESQIRFYGISSGKLRRYMDLKNFQDPFRVMKGLLQSVKLLRQIKPHVIFSKGGFVAVPVVIAGKLLRIPVIIHESDMTPGLANKISIPFASKVCVTFPETLAYINPSKAEVTGLPIREQLLHGDAETGRHICGFSQDKPILLIMGGSLGAKSVNDAIRQQLQKLLQSFDIIHICGKGNRAEEHDQLAGYKQFEYVHDQLTHLLAAADIVISRAGSTSINEFLTLKKPMVLIPLSKQASRGDQILNAQSFEKQGYGKVVSEEELGNIDLFEVVSEVYRDRDQYISKMMESPNLQSIDHVIRLIEHAAQHR